MDQYRSRLKLSENFERHWSILISGEIHMDQSLVHTFSWGNSYGPMVLKVLLKFPLDWYWSIDGSSQQQCFPVETKKYQPEVFQHNVFLRPPRVMDVRAFGSLTVCKLGACKRRGSEKSTFLAIFWGFLIFSGSPLL